MTFSRISVNALVCSPTMRHGASSTRWFTCWTACRPRAAPRSRRRAWPGRRGLGELPRPEVKLLLNMIDALARGIEDDDEVRVWNALGDVRCRAQVGAWVRPGTVVLPKGLWRRSTANSFTATALAPATLTDLGGGACFNDARVEVRKVDA